MTRLKIRDIEFYFPQLESPPEVILSHEAPSASSQRVDHLTQQLQRANARLKQENDQLKALKEAQEALLQDDENMTPSTIQIITTSPTPINTLNETLGRWMTTQPTSRQAITPSPTAVIPPPKSTEPQFLVPFLSLG